MGGRIFKHFYTRPNMNKEQGIKQTADNSGEEWQNLAYSKCLLFLTYAREFNINQFQMYDIRETINKRFVALPDPPHNRAFGAVARRLVKEGKIEIIGYKPTESLNAHNAVAAVYQIKK